LGSLQRRLRGCMSGVHAEPYAFDIAELTALESYLMQRVAGLLLETPGVRQ
jgi:L-cysteine S-thiosulfotransferase